MATFTPVTPRWSPRDYADTRAAWEGPLTGRPEITRPVEAGRLPRDGRRRCFLLGPWSVPTRMAPAARSLSQTILSGMISILLIAMTLGSAAVGAAQRAREPRRSPRRREAGDGRDGRLRRHVPDHGAPRARRLGPRPICSCATSAR